MDRTKATEPSPRERRCFRTSGHRARSMCGLALFILSVACDCGDEGLRPAPPPGSRVETFRQADRAVIDVLWVIDNSPTMRDVQDNLAENLLSFFRFLDAGDVDYQIAVTTTDVRRHGGRLVGSPEILTRSTPDVLRAFRGNVQVGTEGSAKEEGLAAAELVFLHRDDFLRQGAYVFIVWVSDQDDRSFGEVRYFWRVFSQIQGIGNEGMVTLAAIVGPDEQMEPGSPFRGCVSEQGSAQAGLRYLELIEKTGGAWGSICDESFAETLEGLGATAVGLRRKFELTEAPDLDSMEVRVYYPCDVRLDQIASCDYLEDECGAPNPANRALVCLPPRGGPNGWVYEDESRSLFFQGDSVPGMRSLVEVVYMPERSQLEW